MNRHTSDEREVYEKFVSHVPIYSEWDVDVYRADHAGGWCSAERRTLRNTLLSGGLDEMAALIVGDAASATQYIAVGTVTAVASLESTNFGEVARKSGHTVGSSNEFIICAATYGGAADAITSVALETAAIGNHASSGQGVLFNALTGVSTTLADSDLLSLTCHIRIGSHG